MAVAGHQLVDTLGEAEDAEHRREPIDVDEAFEG
jgi:hypothetical protein